MKIEIDSTQRALLESLLAKANTGSEMATGDRKANPVTKPDVSSFDLSALNAKYGGKCEINKVTPSVREDGAWLCYVKRPDGKIRGERLKVRTAASAKVAPQASAPAQKKTLRESWDPAAPTATAESRDLIFRASANLNRMASTYQPAAEWYWNFLTAKTAEQRAAFLAPHLARTPIPAGNWVVATAHIRNLMASLEPQPTIAELIALGRYADAWNRDANIRAEFGTLAAFEAYQRHSPQGRALLNAKANQDRDHWLSENVVEVRAGAFQRKRDPLAQAKAAEAFVDENLIEIAPGCWTRKRN